MTAVKWGCVNMPAAEEHDVGRAASVCENLKAKRVKTESDSLMLRRVRRTSTCARPCRHYFFNYTLLSHGVTVTYELLLNHKYEFDPQKIKR